MNSYAYACAKAHLDTDPRPNRHMEWIASQVTSRPCLYKTNTDDRDGTIHDTNVYKLGKEHINKWTRKHTNTNSTATYHSGADITNAWKAIREQTIQSLTVYRKESKNEKKKKQ